jgi:hypothetical protein
MNATTVYDCKRFLWIAITITGLRIIYLLFNHRDLDIEEAQYWTWSQHLAMGYHSKPPMISWVIYFTTQLFGHAEWAIRLFSPIAYFFSALALYGLGKKLYHPAIGFWSAVTVLLLPGVTYSATIISTDPLLVLFWSLALYALANASQTNRLRWWILCGIAIGLGMLSKYTMVVFFISLLLYLICTIEHPFLWKKPGAYLAVLIALMIFSPNAVWNTLHHNAAMHHVISHNIDIEGVHFKLKELSFFVLAQIAILGPVLFLFLIIALLRSQRLTQRESSRFLICFTLPMLILICMEALLSRAYANWAAIAYPSGVVLAVAYMWEKKYRRWLKFSVWLNLLAAIVLCGWELAIAYGYCHWPHPNQPSWSDFGKSVQRYSAHKPGALFLVDNRELWSKTMYYGKVPKDQLYVWDPHRQVDWVDYPQHLSLPTGKDFILITYQDHLPDSMQQAFMETQNVGSLTAQQRLLGREAHIYIYTLRGFRGYASDLR